MIVVTLIFLDTFWSFPGPLHGTCHKNSIDPGSPYNMSLHISTDVSPVWAIALCPLENECLNGKHSCNRLTQRCIDLAEGFKCECKSGFAVDGHGLVKMCLLRIGLSTIIIIGVLMRHQGNKTPPSEQK